MKTGVIISPALLSSSREEKFATWSNNKITATAISDRKNIADNMKIISFVFSVGIVRPPLFLYFQINCFKLSNG